MDPPILQYMPVVGAALGQHRDHLGQPIAHGGRLRDMPVQLDQLRLEPFNHVGTAQLHRIGDGRAPKRDASPLLALIVSQLRTARRTRRYKAWIARRAA